MPYIQNTLKRRRASHSCMSARGVNTPGVMMTTSRMMGIFRSDERSRREVLALMGYSGSGSKWYFEPIGPNSFSKVSRASCLYGPMIE